MNYRVLWEIDVEAENPRKAAEEARRIQLDPNSIANVFGIAINLDGPFENIDLEEEE